MSGPLASWVLEHSRAGAAGRFVLVALALDARHDGTKAQLSADLIHQQTGLGDSTVRKWLARLRASGEIVRTDGGGGRKRPAAYRVMIRWCTGECKACDLLDDQQKQPKRGHHVAGNELPVDNPAEKGPPRSGFQRKGPPGSEKGPPRSVKGPPGGPTTYRDGIPPLGDTVTHPESEPAVPPQAAAGSEPGPDANPDSPASVGRAERWAALGRSPPSPNGAAPPDTEAERARQEAELLAMINPPEEAL